MVTGSESTRAELAQCPGPRNPAHQQDQDEIRRLLAKLEEELLSQSQQIEQLKDKPESKVSISLKTIPE